MNIRRGDVVICALQGELGKPRPAVVLQSDLFNESHGSMTVCPVTSHLLEAPLFRVVLKPEATNGLKNESQVMVDKLSTVGRQRIKSVVGHLAPDDLARVETAVMLWLGLRG
jgi:mRNA interferase MazF